MGIAHRWHCLPLRGGEGVNISAWFESLKPKVYIASIAPVLIGSALAWADGTFDLLSFPLLLLCAMLIQTISNWVNDVYDYRRGADERGRLGPRRVLVEGFLEPHQLIRASWAAAVLCFLLGLPLVARSGPIVLVIGLACLAAAWFYTGGRYNLAYHGLGDVAAFVFFGVLAVAGTHFVHSREWTLDALILSCGPGLLAANILGVNNLRDIPTDTLVGKRTLAVRIGGRNARMLYSVMTFAAIIFPSAMLFSTRGVWATLPIASLPFGVGLCIMVWKREGVDLNPALFGTALLYILFTVLTVVGLVLSGVTELVGG
jgi:1,4-dihydroxy-2-naphthoate polyprenyltransferase